MPNHVRWKRWPSRNSQHANDHIVLRNRGRHKGYNVPTEHSLLQELQEPHLHHPLALQEYEPLVPQSLSLQGGQGPWSAVLQAALLVLEHYFQPPTLHALSLGLVAA